MMQIFKKYISKFCYLLSQSATSCFIFLQKLKILKIFNKQFYKIVLLKNYSVCKVVFIVILIFLFIYYKPIYSVLILSIFASEYVYFINFIVKLKTFQKNSYYCSFSIKSIDNNLSTYEIWNRISELNAFKKMYILCLKKRLNAKSILISSFIILTGIPVKVVTILFFIFKRQSDLKSCLLEYFYINYDNIKNCKIEVYDKTIYLNCSTRSDVLLKIIALFPKKSPEEVAITYKTLVQIHTSHLSKNEKLNQVQNPFNLGRLKTEEGVNLKKAHWSSESFQTIYGESVRSLIHATSRIPEMLTPTQVSGVAITNLKKPGAQAAGSIITNNGYEFHKTVESTIYVPKWKIEYVYYDIYGTDHTSIYTNLFREQNQQISEFLGGDNALVGEIVSGHYKNILDADINTGIEEIGNEIKKFS